VPLPPRVSGLLLPMRCVHPWQGDTDQVGSLGISLLWDSRVVEFGRVPVACGSCHPPSKPGRMPLYHTSAREQCHDSTPYLLLAGHGGTPVALHHAAPRLAKPRRGVTSTIGSTCALQEQAQTRQRTHILQGPDAETSLCRVCTRGQPSHATVSTAARADAADQPTPLCQRYLDALLPPRGL